MIDCDNVLCNLQEAAVNILNERCNSAYTIEDFTTYNVSACISKEHAIAMTAIYSEAGIYDKVQPISGAQDAVQKLIRAGHEVYIVTYSVPSVFKEKVNWIKFHFPMIDEDHIIAMKHKWLFRCDVMIEDNLDNLLNGHHYDRIVFDYPWNRAHDEVYSIYRVFNWNDALDAVNKINKIWSGND